MSNEQIQGIEESIKRSKKLVEMGESLERLRNNRDFKKVVIEGYLEQECIRLVHLKSDPSCEAVQRQNSIVRQIDSIGCFNDFLTITKMAAGNAVKQMHSDEAMREEILAEELTND